MAQKKKATLAEKVRRIFSSKEDQTNPRLPSAVDEPEAYAKYIGEESSYFRKMALEDRLLGEKASQEVYKKFNQKIASEVYKKFKQKMASEVSSGTVYNFGKVSSGTVYNFGKMIETTVPKRIEVEVSPPSRIRMITLENE